MLENSVDVTKLLCRFCLWVQYEECSCTLIASDLILMVDGLLWITTVRSSASLQIISVKNKAEIKFVVIFEMLCEYNSSLF